MAGDSAHEVARRAREKADQLLKQAELFERGAEGERVVADLLTQLPPEWFVIHDIRWPGRERANIDHVVVGPTGVFVIDAKNWTGTVALSHGVLKQNGYSRMKVIESALTASSAVADLLAIADADVVVPVICFVGEGRATGALHGVELCTTDTLLDTLLNHRGLITPERLQFLRFDLDMATRPATDRGRHTVSGDLPAAVRPPNRAAHRARTARQHGEPKRSRSAPKVIGLWLLLWWLACMVAYYVLSPAADYQPALLGCAYLAAGIATFVAVMRRR
jgi:hypothetical protein